MILTTLIDDQIHEAYLQIVDAVDQTVVTVIEILSPTNKVVGSRGRDSYEKKRREVMTSTCHFVEIDLLRDGEPIHVRELRPEADYFVHVSRRDARPKGYVCPIQISQQLPVIFIPLKAGDEDGSLDLQSVLTTVYDRAAYDLAVDYHKNPMPPLHSDDATWADTLLKEKGLR